MDRFDLIKRGGGDNPPFLFSEKIELQAASAAGAWDSFVTSTLTFANCKKLYLTYGMLEISSDDNVTLQTLPFTKAGGFIGIGANSSSWPQIPMVVAGANFNSNAQGFNLDRGNPSELNFGIFNPTGNAQILVQAYIFYPVNKVNPVTTYVTLSLSGYAYRS